MTLYRKTTLVQAEQATEAGTIDTERGPMAYAAGDWLLTTVTPPFQTWPISAEYLAENYERIEPQDDPGERDAVE